MKLSLFLSANAVLLAAAALNEPVSLQCNCSRSRQLKHQQTL
jgi:hypothetical protein